MINVTQLISNTITMIIKLQISMHVIPEILLEAMFLLKWINCNFSVSLYIGHRNNNTLFIAK